MLGVLEVLVNFSNDFSLSSAHLILKADWLHFSIANAFVTLDLVVLFESSHREGFEEFKEFVVILRSWYLLNQGKELVNKRYI